MNPTDSVCPVSYPDSKAAPLSSNGLIIILEVSKKSGMRIRTGFNWLRIGTSDELL
jgi:hypothetical protein